MKKYITTLLILAVFIQVMTAQTDTAEYERRPFQFTFMFPPLSTNGAANVNIVNDVSLNLFIGVSGGVEVLEAGGFINIDRFYMNGVQMAGFGNTVGGHVSGVQLSGFYNVAGTHVTGLQGAGFVNVTGSSVTGLQAAGFANVAGGGSGGLQAAGFINVTGGDVEGMQAAGFANVSGGRLDGMQASGFINVSRQSEHAVQASGFGNISGSGEVHFQGAGFFNVAENVRGAQAAGFINVAENVRGAQAAGFMNVAGMVTGTQLSGFLNICDSIDGVPLSFISIVKKNGYRSLGFSINEVEYATLSFRMGVRRLYNIYSLGKPFGPGSRWMYGGGLGTELPLSPRSLLNIEATVHQELWIAPPGIRHFLYIDRLNLHSSAKFLFGWKVDDHFSIHAGPTFNVAVSHANPELGQLAYYEIPPYSVYNRTANNFRDTNVRMWFGLEGGIRF
jgi:hypothetical protein